MPPIQEQLLTPTVIPWLTPTPESINTPIPQINILKVAPVQWNTGETADQVSARMNDTIKAEVDANPDQYSVASQTLSEQYLDAVVNIDFSSGSTHWGGTATFIGFNYKTNESIFLTDTHVLTGRDKFRIKQPHSGLDVTTSLSNAVVANSPAGFYNDISVVKLPFIPDGISTFPVIGSDLCVNQQPPENMQVFGFGFPYINGGPQYSQFFMNGYVETLGDPVNGYANCWYEAGSDSIFVPTGMPVRVGASGTLILDVNGQVVGLVKSMSPHGAVIVPIPPGILQSLIQETGFVFGN